MTTQNELPVEFQLTDEQKAEIQSLIQTLHEKCVEYEAPFMVAVCTGADSEGKFVGEANYFNGERTPDCMALACSIIKRNITHPMELILGLSGRE